MMCGNRHKENIAQFYDIYRTMKDDVIADDLENRFTRECEYFEGIRNEMLDLEDGGGLM